MTPSELRSLSGGAIGVVDVACPWCGPQRRSPVNRRRKTLRIWDDGDFITFKCIRCEEAGWARDGNAAHVSAVRRPAPPPPPPVDRTELVSYLWGRSVPAPGTLVETYLRSRKCWLPAGSIRFLPGTDKHPPGMIARFGRGKLTGVHVTRLKPDGNGKAGTETDKIIIGDCIGQPILIHENQDKGELIVSEGIEDALSFALALGWSAWAAGSSARIPHVVANTSEFEQTYIAVDGDRAGKAALQRAAKVAAVTPVKLGTMDANEMIKRYGAMALAASVDWCDLQHQYKRGKINLNRLMGGFDRLAPLIPACPD